jgi:FkbM family methyltransferase
MSNGQSAMRGLDRMKLCFRGAERDFYFRRNSSDIRVIGQIFHDNCYDLRRLRRFEQIIELVARNSAAGRRPLIVDAGANIGAASVYFAAKFPDALVMAIEPDFGNYELLAENTKGLEVRPLHCALAASERRRRVIDVGEGFWGYRTQLLDDGEKGGVRSITMSRLYEAHAAECFPFIVKIDIEGGEKDLFSTDVGWVHRTPLLIIELHDWLLPCEGNSSSFLTCVSQLDRDFVYIGEDVYSIANDLDRYLPWTGDASAMRRAASSTGTPAPERESDRENSVLPITALEEPLDDELVAAMTDFQSEIRILRHSDDELQAALDALNVQRTQLEEALAGERSAAHEAQQAVANTKAGWVTTQEELRNTLQELADTRQMLASTQHESATTQQELSSARQELASAQQGLASAQQGLANTQQGLASTQQELLNVQQELVSTRQELSGTHEKLTGLEQELTSLRTREKSLVSELSLTISSLQQLRDQLRERDRSLRERDRSLTEMQKKSDRIAKKLKDLQQRESTSKDTCQRLKVKLDARGQELAALREQKLVRIAIKVGNRMNRWTSGVTRASLDHDATERPAHQRTRDR